MMDGLEPPDDSNDGLRFLRVETLQNPFPMRFSVGFGLCLAWNSSTKVFLVVARLCLFLDVANARKQTEMRKYSVFGAGCFVFFFFVFPSFCFTSPLKSLHQENEACCVSEESLQRLSESVCSKWFYNTEVLN